MYADAVRLAACARARVRGGWFDEDRGVCCAALILAGLFGLSARADCITEFFTDIPKDTARRNCWPVPFVYPARQATRRTLRDDGRQRLGAAEMSDQRALRPVDGKLTPAGEAKVESVLSDVPAHHRYVFVHRARTRQETATRIDRSSSSSCSRFRRPSIRRSWSPPDQGDGYPAERSDVVGGSFQASAPDPKLMPQGRRQRRQQRRRALRSCLPIRATLATRQRRQHAAGEAAAKRDRAACGFAQGAPPGRSGAIPGCAASTFGRASLDGPATGEPPCAC